MVLKVVNTFIEVVCQIVTNRVVSSMISIKGLLVVTSDENSTPPFPVNLTIDLSEGSHLGYAGQWFIFSILLGIGYPVYVKKQGEKPEVK